MRRRSQTRKSALLCAALRPFAVLRACPEHSEGVTWREMSFWAPAKNIDWRGSMRVVSGAPKRFLSGFLAILVALALSGPAQADDGRHLRVNLTPAWTTGIVSDGVGSSDIVLTDLAGGGVPDILTRGGSWGF